MTISFSRRTLLLRASSIPFLLHFLNFFFTFSYLFLCLFFSFSSLLCFFLYHLLSGHQLLDLLLLLFLISHLTVTQIRQFGSTVFLCHGSKHFYGHSELYSQRLESSNVNSIREEDVSVFCITLLHDELRCLI
jgi:hypothetical protein